MLKKLMALTMLVAGLSASACWFTELNFAKAYIARINTAETFYSALSVVGTGDFEIMTGTYIPSERRYFNSLANPTYEYRATDVDRDGHAVKRVIYPILSGDWWVYRTSMEERADFAGSRWGISAYSMVENQSYSYYRQDVLSPVTSSAIIPTSSWEGIWPDKTGAITVTVTSIPWTGDPVACPPAGTQDLPAQIWVKLQPRSEQGAPAITEAKLQYKKLPSGAWTTFKTLNSLNWTIDYSKPVQLFGPNIFDPPGAQSGDQYLVRLWFSDGIFENADLDENAPEGGDTVWRNQWVTKITISAHRRPGL